MKRLPGDTGLAVPDDFDVDAYVAVAKAAATHAAVNAKGHRAFAAAWNGLSHRYRATHEASSEFVRAMAAGDAPPMEERHRQEHALFVFATTALSSLECFCFGAYCLGFLAGTREFPMSHERDLRIHPTNVRDMFTSAFPMDSLTSTIASVLAANEYAQLTDLRNALSHRGTLPRSIFLSVGGGNAAKAGAFVPSNPKSLSSDWQFDRVVDAELTRPLLGWLGLSLQRLLPAAHAFAVAHVNPSSA